MTPFEIIGLIGLVAGLATSIAGTVTQYQEDKKVQEQDQTNLETAWARDDSTLQRSRKDAELAGYSPLAGLSMSAGNTSPTQLSPARLDMSSITDSLGKVSDFSLANQQRLDDKNLKDAQIDLLHKQTRGKELENLVDEATYLDKIQKLKDDGAITAEELEQLRKRGLGTHPDQIEANRHNTALENETKRHNSALEEESTRHNKEAESLANTIEEHAENQREYDRNKVTSEDTTKYGISIGKGSNQIYYEVTNKKGYSMAPVFPDLPVDKDKYRTISVTSPSPSINYDGKKMDFYGYVGSAELPVYAVKSDNNEVLGLYAMAPYNKGSSYLIDISSAQTTVTKSDYGSYMMLADGLVYWNSVREFTLKQ